MDGLTCHVERRAGSSAPTPRSPPPKRPCATATVRASTGSSRQPCDANEQLRRRRQLSANAKHDSRPNHGKAPHETSDEQHDGHCSEWNGVIVYKEWHDQWWPGRTWAPVVDTPQERLLHRVVLTDYLHDLMDATVSAGVPRRRLADLRFANRLLTPKLAWPADEYDLTNLAAGYFRDGLHLPRQGYYHAKEDLVALEDGARTLRSPLEC